MCQIALTDQLGGLKPEIGPVLMILKMFTATSSEQGLVKAEINGVQATRLDRQINASSINTSMPAGRSVY